MELAETGSKSTSEELKMLNFSGGACPQNSQSDVIMWSRHTFVSCVLPHSPQDGYNPLYLASQGGHCEVVDAILKSGADPNLSSMVWD